MRADLAEEAADSGPETRDEQTIEPMQCSMQHLLAAIPLKYVYTLKRICLNGIVF